MRRSSKPTRYPGVQRIADGMFRVRFEARDPRTGKIREIDRIVNVATPADAAARRQEIRRAFKRGEPERLRVRVGDFARSWLRTKLPALKPSTAHRYVDTLEGHILPELGDLYVDAVAPADVIAWRDRQRGAPSTINGRLRLLRTLFADARVQLGLPRDPTERIPALREDVAGDDDDTNTLTADELRLLLEAARTLTPKWYPLIATMAMTGMRFGEATALRWEDVDEAGGVIRIRRAQWHRRVGTPKTGTARTVPLLRALAAILAQHRRDLLESQAPGLAAGWIFPGATGELLYGSALTKPLAKVLAAAKITRRFTPHGLRRTFNNLVRQVTSGQVVRAITGHVTEAMTEHYSHVGAAEKFAAASLALRLVSGDGTGDGPGDGKG